MLQYNDEDAVCLTAIVFAPGRAATCISGDALQNRRLRFGPRRNFRFALPDGADTDITEALQPGALTEFHLDRSGEFLISGVVSSAQWELLEGDGSRVFRVKGRLLNRA